MKHLPILYCILLWQTVLAQPQIDPTSESYTFKMKPFCAEYSQMGSKMLVNATQSPDGSVFNVIMSMPDVSAPQKVITDVIGLSKDGSFVYRDFHMPFPSWAYHRAAYRDDSIKIESFSKAGANVQAKDVNTPVFDGSFLYWQLVDVNKELKSFYLQRWKMSPQGPEVGKTGAPFLLSGEAEITIGDINYKCRIYSVEVAPGSQIRSYVSDQKPYLIKQEYQQGENDLVPIITLTKLLNYGVHIK